MTSITLSRASGQLEGYYSAIFVPPLDGEGIKRLNHALQGEGANAVAYFPLIKEKEGDRFTWRQSIGSAEKEPDGLEVIIRGAGIGPNRLCSVLRAVLPTEETVPRDYL